MSQQFDDRPVLAASARMQPSNNPDIALGQEWIGELDRWYEQHGLRGYDPFDVKQHPSLRKLQRRPLLRKASTAATDAFPHLARRLLHVEQTENPKAFALMASGSLRMLELTGEGRYAERAEALLQWLLEHPAETTGLAWGYPFDVQGSGVDTPAGTPVSVVTAIAGQAFLEAHDALQESRYLDAAHRIGEHFLRACPRLSAAEAEYCFAYTPHDHRRVHNANLLVAEFLTRAALSTGERAYAEAAAPALAYTLRRQREDGAWPYGDWQEGEPYEPRLMALVDHHHTGFVLRSLHGIWSVTADAQVLEAITKGFAFYRTLFSPDGMPLTAHGRWPVDIHACAEAVLCPSTLAPLFLPARPLAINALRWAHYYMRDEASGAPYYRKYPWFTSRVAFPRWGVAWMYRAVAEYLWYFYPRSVPGRG